MDEVDGKPGPVALQSGHLDAPLDVSSPPCASLTYAPAEITQLNHEKVGPTARGAKSQENYHENVPGK